MVQNSSRINNETINSVRISGPKATTGVRTLLVARREDQCAAARQSAEEQVHRLALVLDEGQCRCGRRRGSRRSRDGGRLALVAVGDAG